MQELIAGIDCGNYCTEPLVYSKANAFSAPTSIDDILEVLE